MLRISRLLSGMARLTREQKQDREDMLDPGVASNTRIELFKKIFGNTIDFNAGGGHWLWTGAAENSKGKTGTYGKVTMLGKSGLRIHKLAYEVANGPVIQRDGIKPNDPMYLEVDHKCRVPLCCNPDHLQVIEKHLNSKLVTERANEDKMEHGRRPDEDYIGKLRQENDALAYRVFSAWKKQKYLPDFWYYLNEFKNFYEEWLEELRLSADESTAVEACWHLANKIQVTEKKGNPAQTHADLKRLTKKGPKEEEDPNEDVSDAYVENAEDINLDNFFEGIEDPELVGAK